MSNLSTRQILLPIGLIVILFSCRKEHQSLESAGDSQLISLRADQSSKYNTFKGPQVRMGDDSARSWVIVSHTGVPLEIGIEMTETAITSLGDANAAIVLPLHIKAIEATAYEHLVINWNSHGHGAFTAPHFDFHFYTITNEERMAIPAYASAIAAFDNLPPAGYMPAGYSPVTGGVIQMGKHWRDAIVTPATFTKTMFYGSYNGAVNFVEPMVTRNVLLGNSEFSLPFEQPSLFAEQGYYPVTYNFFKNGDKFNITLSDFVWRE